jgi:energy-coupling factor transporter ATP-binding protein EcfA2
VTLRVENVSHTYLAGTPLARQALLDVSLSLAEGGCSAVVGISGSGKSTLARIVAGLMPPDRGRILLDERDVTARPARTGLLPRLVSRLARAPRLLANNPALPSPEAASLAPRRPILLAFQNPEDQFFTGSVLAEVLAGLAPPRDPVLDERAKKQPDHPLVVARRAAAAAAEEAAREALRIVELPVERYGARNPFTLSGGEQRRLALAILLARRPRVLVLDEPSAGLDIPGRALLYAAIARVRQTSGTAVLVVSHDLEEVAAIADETIVLHDGRIAAEGETADVLANAQALEAAGLTPPPLVRVRALLAARGYSLPGRWLSVDEAAQAITEALAAGTTRKR